MNGGSLLLDRLRSIVGRRNVLTTAAKTKSFVTGYRFGSGSVLAVVRPATLVEQWRVLNACVNADVIMLLQAANTGLTGGSTPVGDYDRPVVVINTLRVRGLHLIDNGRQVVCLPGTTLFDLEKALAPIRREPHSVIGSSCIGASVFGGVCNNSGGALVQRGPAYTEMALYAQVDSDGLLRLVNHIGIDLGSDPEEILHRIQSGTFSPEDIVYSDARASDQSYANHVRQVDADSPARFNADPARLFEASGSAGKIALFALRLDTFAREEETTTFYIGTNDPAELTALRRAILTQCRSLPISAEYIHRDAFDLAARYGKDMFLAIRYLGTARLPRLFALKRRLDRMADGLGDRLLQFASHIFPDHLPPIMRAYRDCYEHHLILKVAGDGIDEARTHLSQALSRTRSGWYECTPSEASAAFLHRFAVAGAAVRYRAMHRTEVEDIVALDIALRRNDPDWFETLSDTVAEPIVTALYYGHFFCHVLHQDYIVRKGCDAAALKHELLASLDARGAEYPAEHNVGHLYVAKPALADHYHALDPGNRFNPGIGKTSRCRDWC